MPRPPAAIPTQPADLAGLLDSPPRAWGAVGVYRQLVRQVGEREASRVWDEVVAVLRQGERGLVADRAERARDDVHAGVRRGGRPRLRSSRDFKVYPPAGLLDELTARARGLGVTRNELVVRLLREGLERERARD